MDKVEIKTPTPAGDPPAPNAGDPPAPNAGDPPAPEPPAPAAATLTPELVQQMIDASLGAFNDAMQILKAQTDEKVPPEDGGKKEEVDLDKKPPENDEEIKNDW